MAGIKERVGYSDAHLGFLYTRRAAKISRHHEVIRNLEVVKADLNEECQGDIDALAKNGPAPVSQLFSLRIPECQPENISESVSNYIDGGPYVVLSPGSAWETKRWHAKGFREVAEALVAKNRRVLIVGAPQDSSACDDVCTNLSTPTGAITNMCAKTSLVELMHLIRCSTAVICNDSLALHIGSATKVPTVAIFCATSPLFGFGPWRNRAIVVEKGELFCKPCRRHGSRKCPNGTNACMVGVSSGDVVRAFDELFADETAKRGASLRIV